MNETNLIRILVLDKGFVIVCRCEDPNGFPFWLPVTNSRTIRRWGTTEGLGQLCTGPTTDTVLDKEIQSETIPCRAIVRVIDVDQKKWSKHLSPVGGKK